MTAPFPPSPKTSIFDRTHPGTERAPSGPGFGPWFRRLWSKVPPPAAEAPVAEDHAAPGALRDRLRKPARTVALPTLPDPAPEMAQLLEEVLAEATGIPPEPPPHTPFLPAETRPILPPPPPEEQDLATRALPPLRSRGGRMAWAAAGLAVACGVALGLWALLPLSSRPSSPSVPSEIAVLKARAERGDVAAMRLLGLHYAYGLQVPADPAEAVRWLDRAAQAGSGSARQELAALRRTP